jgi:chitinase
MHAQMRLIAYYPTWSVYGRNYFFKDLPIESLTHVTLAFALPQNDGGLNCEELDRLNVAELRERGGGRLKIGIAVGGWGTCEEFNSATNNEECRHNLISSCAALFAKYDLDYLEFDWEYPANEEQTNNLRMVLLGLKELLPPEKQLSICLPCFQSGFVATDLVPLVDFFILMGYDLSGSWSDRSGHHSALIPLISNHVRHLSDHEMIPKDKIVLGCPLYARTFAECTGPNQKFKGPGLGSFGEAGSMDYKDVVAMCKEIMHDPNTVSQYSIYKKNFVSFDGPRSIERKCDWVKEEGLSGLAFWNAAGDALGEGSLIKLAANNLK